MKKLALKPGADGSFFHITKKPAIRLPKNYTANGTIDAKKWKSVGLLAASDSQFKYSGRAEVVTSREQFDSKKVNGPVVVEWNKRGRAGAALRSVATFARRAKNAGATALVLLVKEKSSLISIASKRTGFGELDSGNNISIPVVLFRQSDVSSDLAAKCLWNFDVGKAEKFEGNLRNVIAVLPGSDPELRFEYILFSAHLDHLGKVGDVIYNGADDDATGVTAVLTLADAFGAMKVRPKRSIVFMLYWGEERGLLGSKAYAKTPSIPLEKTICNVNIEMIGRPETGANGKIWVTGWEKSDLGSIMNEDSKKQGVEIFQHPRFSSMLYRSSDNWSLAQKGVIAHSFSAGSLHKDYHQPTDDWQKLNIEHMTEVIKGLYFGSQSIAEGKKTPKAAK